MHGFYYSVWDLKFLYKHWQAGLWCACACCCFASLLSISRSYADAPELCWPDQMTVYNANSQTGSSYANQVKTPPKTNHMLMIPAGKVQCPGGWNISTVLVWLITDVLLTKRHTLGFLREQHPRVRGEVLTGQDHLQSAQHRAVVQILSFHSRTFMGRSLSFNGLKKKNCNP